MVDFDALALAPCIAAFGEAAVYRPGAGPEVALNGVFNEFASETKVADSGEMQQVIAPTLGIRLADLDPGAPLPCRGEAITVRGRTWQITASMADGFGHLLFKLKRTGA